jgi:peptide/nickel transport system substrate-binding protein
MKKYLVPISIMLLVVLLMTSCGKTATTTTVTPTTPGAVTSTTSPASSVVKGGTLRIVYPYSPSTTPGDPNDRNEAQRSMMEWVCYEPLVRPTHSGSAEAWLAKSWEWGPDNKYITFKLREDVRFHDGTKFTSEAVKLEGDLVISTGESNAINWDRWEIIDDYTVRLYLKVYMIDFWSSVTGINMCFFSPTAYKAHQPDGKAYIAENPIGTGPFKYASFEKDISLKFVKNTDYWQPGKPYLDGLNYLVVKEDLTQRAAMEAGDGDLLELQQGKFLSDMKNEGFNILSAYGGTDFLMFDTMNADSVFSILEVREAIEYALNKKAMADALGYGFYIPNNQMSPPDNPDYNPDLPSRDYNPAKAKELLAQAGYPNGLTIKMITMGSDPKDLAIQQYLAEVNIQVEIDNMDNAKFWNTVMTGWTDEMVSTGYGVTSPFAAWIKFFFPPSGFLDVSAKIPDEVIAKLDPALSEPDPAKVKTRTNEIIKQLYEYAYLVPIYSNSMGMILTTKVHATGFFDFFDFSVWTPADIWMDK